MPDDRHNAAFVFGAILGGIAGAAITLWKTPQSGVQLRTELSQGLNDLTGIDLGGAPGPDRHSRRPPLQSPIPGRTTPERLSSRALEFAERAAAPLVGVRLGQTANEGVVERTTVVETTAPPAAGAATPPVGEPSTPPSMPVGTASGEAAPAGIGHAASTEELAHPQEGATVPASQTPAGTVNPSLFTDPDRS